MVVDVHAAPGLESQIAARRRGFWASVEETRNCEAAVGLDHDVRTRAQIAGDPLGHDPGPGAADLDVLARIDLELTR